MLSKILCVNLCHYTILLWIMIRIIFIELQVLLKKLVYCTNLKECFLLKNIRRKKKRFTIQPESGGDVREWRNAKELQEWRMVRRNITVRKWKENILTHFHQRGWERWKGDGGKVFFGISYCTISFTTSTVWLRLWLKAQL